MEYQIIVDHEWAIVRYHPTDNYVYHTFKKPISGQLFRDTLNAGLAALAHNGAYKWLSDDRKNAEFTPEDIAFATQDWGPRAAQAGWKFWALIVPETIAGRAGMTKIVEVFYNLGVRVMIFTDVKPAMEWLLKQ